MQKPATPTFPPNDALKVFAPVIGAWDTVGTHGLIPGVTLHGRTTFEWHESRAFIRITSSIREDVGIPAGVSIIGSDDKLGTFTMLYYDIRGVSRIQQVSMEGGVLKWWRDAPNFSQRYSLTLSKDGLTMTGKGELCQDGSDWEKDLDLTYTKAATA